MSAASGPELSPSSSEHATREPTWSAPVFFGSLALVAPFLAFALSAPERAQVLFGASLAWITRTFGWFYVLTVAGLLVFVLWLGLGRFGHVRLGPDDARPEFSTRAWFAMLFSAGMGIGLLFFGVAEPMMHYASPPVGEGGTADAARSALALTFFHWGPHAWGIYATMGAALGYFHFRRGLPLTIRSVFYPLLGERIHGPLGHAVDVLAVWGTLFGLATSLGLGAMQVGAGLEHLFGVANEPALQVGLIVAITLAATASVVSGLDKGIKLLSQANVSLGLALFLFVLLAGPTLLLFDLFADALGLYLGTLAERSLSTDAFGDGAWHASWTHFYWGWWIAWAPFVGTFIARVSKGRTLRELVLGVLAAPTLVTFAWLTVFGGTALHLERSGAAPIAAAVEADVATSLYAVLEALPFGSVTALVAAVAVTLFFVTSSDSGSLVVDMLTSGGHPNPPRWQRVFWALMEGAVAAALLTAGGLKALQSAAVGTGLPFALVLIATAVALSRALRRYERSEPR